MNNEKIPDFNAFLHAPVEQIMPLAPPSVVFAAGGSRRAAVLDGVAPESADYIEWARKQLIASVELLFRYGVDHVFTIAMTPDNFRETGAYPELLRRSLDAGLAGPQALADYARLGCRVRLLGSDGIPGLEPTAERLSRETATGGSKTLWSLIVPDDAAPWRWILEAAQRTGAQTREEAVEALYGEQVPPVTLLLSTGKPTITPTLLPPLLIGKVRCYWRQRPGPGLHEKEWREILYDYAYTRATWQQDKTGRAEAALANRHGWEQAPTLGLGTRIGPFWYPERFPPFPGAAPEQEIS